MMTMTLRMWTPNPSFLGDALALARNASMCPSTCRKYRRKRVSHVDIFSNKLTKYNYSRSRLF